MGPTNKLVERYGDKLSWLMIYTVDAHPESPDPSPYKGEPWPLMFSQLHQPRNYSSRVAAARDVDKGVSKLHGNFTVLVDDLAPHNASGNDPVWCTWGPAPNAAWLVRSNGTVALAQTWFNADGMAEAIDRVLLEDTAGF